MQINPRRSSNRPRGCSCRRHSRKRKLTYNPPPNCWMFTIFPQQPGSGSCSAGQDEHGDVLPARGSTLCGLTSTLRQTQQRPLKEVTPPTHTPFISLLSSKTGTPTHTSDQGGPPPPPPSGGGLREMKAGEPAFGRSDLRRSLTVTNKTPLNGNTPSFT